MLINLTAITLDPLLRRSTSPKLQHILYHHKKKKKSLKFVCNIFKMFTYISELTYIYFILWFHETKEYFPHFLRINFFEGPQLNVLYLWQVYFQYNTCIEVSLLTADMWNITFFQTLNIKTFSVIILFFSWIVCQTLVVALSAHYFKPRLKSCFSAIYIQI